MAITHELIASAGEYTDKNGQTKTRWVKCGFVNTKENGEFSIKIDSTPVEWDGWLTAKRPQAQENNTRGSAAVEGADEDVPF